MYIVFCHYEDKENLPVFFIQAANSLAARTNAKEECERQGWNVPMRTDAYEVNKDGAIQYITTLR